uniref:Uncharacterized protein n=1 Tax=Strongyloides venezuelensis TaxID=75913 RepID=A0A0K0F9H0_STRVS
MNSPRNSYASLTNLKQKLKVLQNQCKSEGRNVKETLCRDAEMIIQKACNNIDKLLEQKNKAIIEKDHDNIKKIDEEIIIIESTAINMANLDILFREKFTDDVVKPYIEPEINNTKDKLTEEEIQKIRKIEQEKIEKKNNRIKEKEKIREAKKDEYINELGFQDVKKNISFKETLTYQSFHKSLQSKKKSNSTSSDDESGDEYEIKNSEFSLRSNSKNKKNKSNNIEFSNQINSAIEQLSKPFTISSKNEVRHSNVRKGPSEEEVRIAMKKVKEEKDEELNHELDKYYAEIEKIIEGDN